MSVLLKLEIYKFANLQSRFNYCLNDCNQITEESQMHFVIIIYFENNTNVVSDLQREMHWSFKRDINF